MIQPTLMQRFNQGLMDTIGGFRKFNSIFNDIFNALISGANKASPSHVATLTGSMDMVQARLGRALLPLIESVSSSLQRFSAMLDTPAGKTAIKGVGGALGWAFNNLSVASTPSWARWATRGAWEGYRGIRGESKTPDFETMVKHIKDKGSPWQQSLAAMFDAAGPTKKSLAGMPQAKITDAASYYDSIQMASLNLSADETGVDVMKEQLKNLENLGGLLKEISDNTSHIKNIHPQFR